MKWIPGISSKILGKYIYIRSERSALLTLLDVKVYDYYGNELTVNKNVKHGFDQCPSAFPYAYSPDNNFDRCCSINTHWIYGGSDPRRRNDECASSTACAHKPCVDFSDPSNNPSSTVAPWLSIHIDQGSKPNIPYRCFQYFVPASCKYGASEKPVLYVTDEDIVEDREPTKYSLKWKLSKSPFQEYINDDYNGRYEKTL